MQSANDHCLFAKDTHVGLMALLVYVDDILVTASSLDDIQSIKDLHSLFTIKDRGDTRYFPWSRIACNSNGLKLSENCGALLPNPKQYRKLVGCPSYLGFTRPNISYSVQHLSQFLTRPCDAHWKAAIHVVRYLKGSPSKGVFLLSQFSFQLRAYWDANWASCSDSKSSFTGFCIILGNALISWKTKKQSTVS
ncbi:UNVERIFIED_CONTAM: Retrovirus-related Pol polyprotein from transposon RE2 [Sesamum calycinum]|uniref:Retrovirus-related Pol polyprotein from transposon RE2 n=1 Tax=Sesamum calycinum TaxID=2727403 RepID=A0AAW2MBG9_9LAMI